MFKKYIRLNILIVKYLFILLLLASCNYFDYSVPDKEIIKSSSWSSNDQPPSYPECESLDLNEQKKCFHYTNLQPLWAVENIKKGAKY